MDFPGTTSLLGLYVNNSVVTYFVFVNAEGRALRIRKKWLSLKNFLSAVIGLDISIALVL
jgi:hypothetical protein